MANVIVIDLQLKGLGTFRQGINSAKQSVAGVNQNFNATTSQINKANRAVRSFTTANARSWQQYQRQVSAGLRKSSPAGFGGIGNIGALTELGLAASAAMLFKKAVDEAAQGAKAFSQSMYGAVGVSSAQAAQLDASQKFAGIGAADWQAIHEQIRRGGVAASIIANREGFTPRPGPYGDLNPAPTASHIIDFLRRKDISQREKDIVMSDLGQPGLRKFENMPEEEFQSLKKAGFGFTPETAAARDAAEARFDRNMERATSMFRPKVWLTKAGDLIGEAATWLSKAIPHAGLFGPAPNAQGPEKTMDRLTKAIDANTQAARENTVALASGKGIGGGVLAGRMPTAAWSHLVLQSENDRTAIQMGAYRL